MGVSNKFGLSLAALGIIGVGALVMTPACSSSETAGPQNDGGSSGGSSSGGSEAGASSGGNYSGTAGKPCVAPPGQIPNPECDDGDESQCPTTASSCAIAPQCGSTTNSCEPLANNTGDVKSFRMRRLIVVSPPALGNSTVQNVVINSGVDMNEHQCGETQTGDFSWLLSFDTAKNTLTTGGAPPCDLTDTPKCDPFNTGYCYVNKTVNGIAIAPITTPVVKGADGTYGTSIIPQLNIPIYFGVPTSIITLPISNGSMSGVKLSADGNCIGSVNPKALGADCSDNYQACSKWLTDASMTGFITLEAADKVSVSLLNETLCVLLTGNKKGPTANGIQSCQRDASGKLVDQGDYCSSPAAPGGCKDSYWLAATFAAAAVKINDGTGIPDCTSGAAPTDSGTPPADTGAPPADAASE